MSAQETQQKVASLADWKKAKRHTVTLHSGVVVDIEIPDLPKLIESGQIPNELLDVAIGVAQGKKVTREDVVQHASFYNKLAAKTVVKPEVTEEQFANDELPFEDKELLVEIATRQRDIDAVGHQLAGLEKTKEWRNFRGIFGSGEDVADL